MDLGEGAFSQARSCQAFPKSILPYPTLPYPTLRPSFCSMCATIVVSPAPACGCAAGREAAEAQVSLPHALPKEAFLAPTP